jgi:hypothetical protein
MQKELKAALGTDPRHANLKALYKFLNQRYFGGKLPVIGVRWSNSRTHYATAKACLKFKNSDVRMAHESLEQRLRRNGDKFNRPTLIAGVELIDLRIVVGPKAAEAGYGKLLGTMIHEMLHIEQYHANRLGDHGPNFMKRLIALEAELQKQFANHPNIVVYGAKAFIERNYPVAV